MPRDSDDFDAKPGRETLLEGPRRRPSVPIAQVRSQKVTPLRQLAELLGAQLFEETDVGVVPRSAAAREILGLTAASDMAEALGRATGLSPTGPSIGELMDVTRREGGASGALRAESGQQTRVALSQLPSGRLVALLVSAPDDARPASADADTVRELATANHEMANVLSAVDALAARGLTHDAPTLAATLQRVRELVGRALADSRATRRALAGEELPAELLEVDTLLAEIEATLRPLAEEARVELSLRISGRPRASLPVVPLRSVVFNLTKNAIEACSEGGHTVVSASVHGPELRLVVSDDGAGMDPALARRVFEPYFTTKREGSGLGLSLVQTLVARMGGEILIETRPGRGSRFVLTLPVGDAGRAAHSGVRAKHADAETTQRLKIPGGER